MPGLGDLGHGVNQPALPQDRHQVGRGRQVPVPHVVPDDLKMPDPLAGSGLQAEQRAGEEVVARTVPAKKVKGCRTGGNVDQAALLVQAHAGPAIGPAGGFPGLPGPGLVAHLARRGNGVEAPAKLAAAGVVSPNVPGGAGQALTHRAAEDEQIPINHPWRGQRNGERIGWPPQVSPQVDGSLVPEVQTGPAGGRVQGIETVPEGDVDPRLAVSAPVHQSPNANPVAGGAARKGRPEGPDLPAGGGVKREDPPPGAGGIQPLAHHQGVALHLRAGKGIPRVVGPGDPQSVQVVTVDLREARVADLPIAASIGAPPVVTRRRQITARGFGPGERDPGD